MSGDRGAAVHGGLAPCSPAGKVTIDKLTYEMMEWEIHYLRGLATSLLAEAMEAGRMAKRMRLQFEASRQRAFREPGYRRQVDRDNISDDVLAELARCNANLDTFPQS